METSASSNTHEVIPVEVVEEMDRASGALTRVSDFTKGFRGVLVGTVLAGPVGAGVGALYVNHEYSATAETVVPNALEETVLADKENDLRLLQGLTVDPTRDDVQALVNEMAGLQALFDESHLHRVQADQDLTAFLDALDGYSQAKGIAASYDAIKEISNTAPVALSSIEKMFSSEVGSDSRYEESIARLTSAMQKLQVDQEVFASTVEDLRSQGLGDFGEQDQAVFKANVEQGMRQNSAVYRLLHSK